MKLRFETAPILLLRGVLERSNPEHAKLLEDVHQVLMSEEEKGSSVKENNRSIVKASLFPPPSPDLSAHVPCRPLLSYWKFLDGSECTWTNESTVAIVRKLLILKVGVSI